MQIVEISALIHQIGWSLIHSLWQDAVIGLVLAAILKLSCRARPQCRYLIACAALAAMIIIPVITAYVLHIRQAEAYGIAAEEDFAPAMNVDSSLQNDQVIESERIAGGQKISWISSTIPETWNIAEKVEKLMPWLISLWLAGVAIYAVKLGGGLFSAMNLSRRPVNVSDPKLKSLIKNLASRLRIKRKINIYESSSVNVPMTIGWIFPVILIPPSSLLGLTPFQLQTIISHELIHIKRHDYLINFLQSIAEALLFYHPVVSWTSRRIREEREYICDDLTVALCKDSIGYARALTKIAGYQRKAEQLAVAATSGLLKNRIFRLVSNSQNSLPGKKTLVSNIMAIVALSLLPAVIFGGFNVLSYNQKTDLNKTWLTGVPKANKNGAENINPYGEYSDDLSKENLRLRKVARQALKDHRGSVIIMNPRSGQVYTIVNQNWAFRRQWPAASTFKVLTGLAGIEENQLKGSGKGFGYNSSLQMNLAKALAVSDNDYFKTLGQNLGSDTLIKYSRRFGLGEKTGIDYPGEVGGYVPDEMGADGREWVGATGADIQVTPLQLAVFVSAIFNGGKILVPQATNEDDAVIAQERGNTSISESALKELKKGLWAAIEIGTAKGARQPNYKVGGKTGTVFNNETKIGLFASYGINNNSEMVVILALDGKDEMGAVAAQVAGEIYSAL